MQIGNLVVIAGPFAFLTDDVDKDIGCIGEIVEVLSLEVYRVEYTTYLYEMLGSPNCKRYFKADSLILLEATDVSEMK